MISRLKHFKVFFSDKNKKKWFVLIKEMIQFSLHKKVLPTDYFRKFLYRKGVNNIKDYLSFKEFNNILLSKKMVFPSVTVLLENKLVFYLLCDRYNLLIPKILAYSHKNVFLLNEERILISNLEELKAFFITLFDDLKSTTFFLKPSDGISGFGCILLKKDNLSQKLEENYNTILSNNYIFQDYISQHPQINSIYSNSVNTLRIIVYTNNQYKTSVVSSLMRFGLGNTITDNTGTGGFYISVNHSTGKLEGIGRQDIAKGGKVFTKHPNTNTKLDGFIIPFYKEACELAISASKYFPSRIIGWDIAISESGPVIVEGNHNPSLHISDVAYGGYCNHPSIKEILNEI